MVVCGVCEGARIRLAPSRTKGGVKMEPKIEIIHLCQRCIDAIRSRGEKVFKGHESESENLEGTNICEFCDEEDITYDCII